MSGRKQKEHTEDGAPPDVVYKLFTDFLTEPGNTSFSPDFDAASCLWYAKNDDGACAQNFEHMYKCLVRFYLWTDSTDVKKSVGSVMHLATHRVANPDCTCNVALPRSIVGMLLAMVLRMKGDEKGIRTAFLRAIQMSRNQVFSICHLLQNDLDASVYCLVPSNGEERKIYFFPYVGVVPLSVASLHRMMGLIKFLFSKDEEMVSLCDAIMQHNL